MRRILLVGQTGELGGAELVMLDLARHFADRCGVVLLADGPLRQRLVQAGVDTRIVAGGRRLLGVSRLGGRLQALASIPEVLRAAWRIAKLGRGYDVLYPNSQKAAIVTMLAGLIARRPVVWHLHDILSADHFGGLQRRIVVAMANRLARRVIANSGASRDAFVAAGGGGDRVGVVPNGLDPAAFAAIDETQAAALRGSLGLKDVRLVGLFGRLAPWKGQHVLIEALPLLPDVHALIVGAPLFGEDGYERSVQDRATALGVAARVHWLGFRDDIPSLMRAVDIVLHTSTSPEPFGRVIVEGMLARRPVLATAVGASAELLGPDHTGLVPPGDPDALAAAVQAVFATSPMVTAARAEADCARAIRLFSIGGMMSSIDRELAMAC